jgi:Uma2 family endonuclease
MALREQLMTAESFWEYLNRPENADRRLELVHGEIREMAGGTGGVHGETIVRLTIRIGTFVESAHLGRMTGAETCFHLNPENGADIVRCPDFAFVSLERAPLPLPSEFVPFAPDFVVEVVSPSDRASDIQAKLLDYLSTGVKLVWVVYPDEHVVVVHTTDGARTFGHGTVLDGGAVLPGFTMPVDDIFSL